MLNKNMYIEVAGDQEEEEEWRGGGETKELKHKEVGVGRDRRGREREG